MEMNKSILSVCAWTLSLISLNDSFITQTKTDKSAASRGLRSRAGLLWYPLWALMGLVGLMDFKVRSWISEHPWGRNVKGKSPVNVRGVSVWSINWNKSIYPCNIHPSTHQSSICPSFHLSIRLFTHPSSILLNVLLSNGPSIDIDVVGMLSNSVLLKPRVGMLWGILITMFPSLKLLVTLFPW